MTTFTVTTAADVVNASDGKRSLREAAAKANAATAADTILFATGLEGATLTLTDGELVLRQDVTIDGDQNDDGLEIELSGDDRQRIFRTSGSDTDVNLANLTLRQGFTGGNGGAVFVGANNLTMIDCDIGDSRAGINGGGIYVDGDGHIVIKSTSIATSFASYSGGAICAAERTS